jgi:predicted PhzF superfamily epimerase YddE/YHI9
VPVWLGRSRFDRFAVLADAGSVRTLRPDPALVAAAGGRGLIVTAPGDGTCDFVSRFFAPQSGVPEDPVTGSAHCALAPYWSARLAKPHLHARQISTRGGELWCELAGPRVKIAGHATRYLHGEIFL